MIKYNFMTHLTFGCNSELRIPNSELILRRLLVCSGRRGRRPLRDWWHTLRLVVGGGVPDAP